MRVLRLTLGAVLGVVVLNFVTWAFIGRSSALELAATDFDAWGALDGSDTLHVYARYRDGANAEGWTQPGDVSEGGRHRIASAFKSSGAGSAVVYHRQRLGSLPDSLPIGHFVLAPVVRRSVPFYALSSAAAYSPGFMSTRDQRWVWVFGWRAFGIANLSVS